MTTPTTTTPGDTESSTSSQKKFWRWSTTKNVPGSIRALSFRSVPSSPGTAQPLASPSITQKKNAKKSETSDDLSYWDDGEDDVMAAFNRSESSPSIFQQAAEAVAAMDLSDPVPVPLSPTSAPPRSRSTTDDGLSSTRNVSLSPASARTVSPVQHSENGSKQPSRLASTNSSGPTSPTLESITAPERVSLSAAAVFGDGIGDADLHLPDMTGLTTLSPARQIPSAVHPEGKKMKFRGFLNAPVIDLDELRKNSWNGIPDEFRPFAWKLLMGYLPLNKERRHSTLDRKRHEYTDCIQQYFGNNGADVDEHIFHQIHIDVLRTNPEVALFQNEIIQKSLERILYVWAIRHPASGYVQGINDLVTPFFIVFLSSHIPDETEAEEIDPEQFSQETLTTVEADSFWCLSKLLDGIQDNYTQSQPGIQRRVFMLKELIQRIDAPLHNHLQNTGVEFLQFSFRWMNCLLMREISLKNTIRMWDTYMAEGVDGYADFHLYVCAAFLLTWTKILQKMETAEEMMMFLQSLPSSKWTNKEIEILLSEAYTLKAYYKDAPSHLNLKH